VLINGSSTGVDVANRFRGDLSKQGIAPMGRCGFQLQLPEGRGLKPGDRVEAIVIENDRQLAHSPRHWPEAGGRSGQRAETMGAASAGAVLAAGSREPFFILGCVRSGTTLLRNILRSHPNLRCPEETHFYRWSDPFRVAEYDNRYKSSAVLRKHREIDGIDDSVFAELYRSCRSRKELMLAYMERFLAVQGAAGKRWYDKSPQNVYGLPLLMADFPGAKFVHIVRNPLDVVASLAIGRVIKVEDVVGAANYWREAVEIVQVMKRAYPERFFEFRYEDFARKPLEVVRSLLEFVGEPYSAEHFLLHRVNPVSHAASGVLTEGSARSVREICAQPMRRYGYQ